MFSEEQFEAYRALGYTRPVAKLLSAICCQGTMRPLACLIVVMILPSSTLPNAPGRASSSSC